MFRVNLMRALAAVLASVMASGLPAAPPVGAAALWKSNVAAHTVKALKPLPTLKAGKAPPMADGAPISPYARAAAQRRVRPGPRFEKEQQRNVTQHVQ